MAVKDLRGKVVLVTGACAGIGRSTALAFAKEGAHVAAVDLDASQLDPLRTQIEALGVRCNTYGVDVSNLDAMTQLASDVSRDFGVVDVLINNAGIGFMGSFLAASLDHWRRILDVNIMGTVYGCHLFLPRMLEGGVARHVVIVASAAANYPPPSVAAYATSKFGVFGFAESLKLELMGSNVGVTTVCPGVINTSIVKNKPGSAAPGVTAEQLERLQTYYARNGSSPDLVASDIVHAVRRGTDVLLTGASAKVFFYLRKISLRLARYVSYATAKQVGYRK